MTFGCLQGIMLPLLLPGSARPFFRLAPEISQSDRVAVDNVVKISDFLTGKPNTAQHASCSHCFLVCRLHPVISPGTVSCLHALTITSTRKENQRHEILVQGSPMQVGAPGTCLHRVAQQDGRSHRS